MPVKILVADDSVTMRKIMELTFAGEAAEVVAVESGQAAVQKAHEFQPDLVFADLSMSGMDGYGLSSAIKNVAGLANTAVIVMASQHQAYDEAKGTDAGVDDHIVKPFDSQVVIDKVAEVLKRPRMIPAGGAPAAVAAPPAPQAPAPPAPPAAPAAPAAPKMPKHTVAFGAGMVKPPPPPKKAPARPVLELAEEEVTATVPEVANQRPRPVSRPTPVAQAAAPTPATGVAAAATAPTGDMADKLSGLGLDQAQIAGVLALSREVIEQVVWEVVPDLAETIIKEEIRRLTSG